MAGISLQTTRRDLPVSKPSSKVCSSLSPDRAKAELWRRGVLRWKLHKTQAEIYDAIKACNRKRFVVNCSRRIGKSFLLAVLSVETALATPGAQVRYAAPTGVSLREFILPIFKKIFSDCPKGLAPVYSSQDNKWIFRNGSGIKLAGTDNGHAEDLRGPAADLCVVDEAAFIGCSLDYLVSDILQPQLLYSKRGMVIIASTPPRSPAHEFTGYVAKAQADGNYIKRTIWDNPLLPTWRVLEFAAEAGCVVENGKIISQSTTWRREYMAEIVTDEKSAVIPEFTDEKRDSIVGSAEFPRFAHRYVIIDTGFIDLTACLFCYHDFVRGKIVFQDELCFERPTSEIISKSCKAKERELWGDFKPYARWGDGDLIVLQDLTSLHEYSITPVSKDNLEAQVNQLRLDVAQNRIEINPACKNLIAHLQYAIWDKRRRAFERSPGLGHFDFVAAAIYAVRHINRQLNPYPALEGISETDYFVRPGQKQAAHALSRAFGG
jgi:hypothetical protein